MSMEIKTTTTTTITTATLLVLNETGRERKMHENLLQLLRKVPFSLGCGSQHHQNI